MCSHPARPTSVASMTRSWRRGFCSAVLFAASGLLIAGLTACGSNGSDESAPAMAADSMSASMLGVAPADLGYSSVDSDTFAAEEASDGAFGDFDQPASPEAAESAAPTPPAAPGAADRTALSTLDSGRDIIYSATVNVRSDDVRGASREAVSIVESFGGIVFAQTTRTEPEPEARLTIKVGPADFSAVLDALSAVGELVDQTLSAQDVTERVVDLDSRITTAEASVLRLRELLEDAADLEDVAQIERELLDRETTLETLRARLRALQGQIQLATITLTIQQSPRVLPESGMLVTAWLSDNAEDPCLGSDHLTVEANATVHFCVEVANTGASALTDVRLSSEDVRLNTAGFVVEQGSFERIEPGKVLVATLAEPVVEGRLASRVVTRGYSIGLAARGRAHRR